MGKRIKRLISMASGLFLEYEVSPHPVLVARSSDTTNGEESLPSIVPGEVGGFLPFKQTRLKGQINPLRPPLHLETVLIGRTLQQQTGYFFGVGFRILDDGYVEAELAGSVQRYSTIQEFKSAVTKAARLPPPNDNF